MKDRLRSRNARRHAHPGRGPFPSFTPPFPRFDHAHKRHGELVAALYDRGLALGELTELIDLRIAAGMWRAA
ncbi:MAG: hypothetical protein EPN98_21275 [Phenylobacterium sp.]|uniref:hypothetical protein n=1 Tax=Phenylobacterium sp. TaxID=1871053 RepID=UPI00120EF126|nr:hypothetical protein [Phenylobacterium sp.]TAL28976.1 MAG: hypothetical protein EPN98_21275 [Phenylobacterium sp.]